MATKAEKQEALFERAFKKHCSGCAQFDCFDLEALQRETVELVKSGETWDDAMVQTRDKYNQEW